MRGTTAIGRLGAAALAVSVLIGNAAAAPREQHGIASFYGRAHDGKRMANGRPFHARGLTAASRSYPLGAKIIVCNVRNGRCIRLTVTDRGPYVRGRIVDVSLAAARTLGFVHSGTTLVTIREDDSHEGYKR